MSQLEILSLESEKRRLVDWRLGDCAISKNDFWQSSNPRTDASPRASCHWVYLAFFRWFLVVGLATCLEARIADSSPRLRKSQEYAKVILAGHRLKTLDSRSAKRRMEFLKGDQIKPHVFFQAYTKRGILISCKNAERDSVIFSERNKGIVFGRAARTILDWERDALLSHAKQDAHVLAIVMKVLKLASDTSIMGAQRAMEAGNLFSQVGTYEKVYDQLGKNRIPPKGYKFLGIRTVPVSHYYLSQQSKTMLAECGEVKTKP